MKLSAIILTKNEATNIKRSMASLTWCDEIIVVDDGSIDDTVAIAKAHGATVYQHGSQGDFASQRRYAASKAKGEWLLHIDADEEVTKELTKDIKAAISRPVASAYYLRRRDFFWGRELKHGETATVRNFGLIRLMKRDAGDWTGAVHEVFAATGTTARLNGFLNHYPHQKLAEFIHEINTYSTLRATELFTNGTNVALWQILVWPLGKFSYTYLVRGGFLDGTPGFAYSFLMSFHSFLVRAKLYQYHHFPRRTS